MSTLVVDRVPALREGRFTRSPMTNGTKPALKTQGELEAAISIGLCRVEQEHMGRGPKDVSAYVLGDMVVVRLTGVLTEAEKHLARSHPVANGRDLLKQVRAQIVETARPALESMIEAVTGVKVISLHHDISTATGEKVVVFTLAQPPIMRQAKHK